jgi:DNA-binding MarR family transcriptional regulator
MKLTGKRPTPVRPPRGGAPTEAPKRPAEAARRPAHESGRLDASLVAMLRATREWEDRIETALCRIGLSGAKFEALRHLATSAEPLTLSELADQASCVRSNITQLVDRLEAEALVERVDDAYDRRVIRAQLTPVGRERYAAGAKLVDAVSAEFAATITAPDRAALNRLLARLQ